MGTAVMGKDLLPSIYDFYFFARGIPAGVPDTPAVRMFRLNTIARWRRTLIRDIEFCLACEMRHCFDKSVTPGGVYPPSKVDAWVVWFERQLGAAGRDWLNKYASHYKHLFADTPKGLDVDATQDFDLITQYNSMQPGRYASYRAAKVAEAMTNLLLVDVANAVFDPSKVAWPAAYGGLKWQIAAKTVHGLFYQTDLNEIVALIDTAFALQHNTSVLFTKNKIWERDDGYDWIEDALNQKMTAYSPYSLLGYTSKELQQLLRDSGFVLPVFIPLARRVQMYDAKKIALRNTHGKVTLEDASPSGGAYRSYVVRSPAFSVAKHVKGKVKHLDQRVMLWEEILADESIQIDVAQPEPALYKKLFKDPSPPGASYTGVWPTPVPTVPAIIADIHKQIGNTPGVSVGALLIKDGTSRFRVFGLAKPLRFYFVPLTKHHADDKNTMQCRVGHTDDADVQQSEQLLVFDPSDPTSSHFPIAVNVILQEIKKAAEP